MYILGSSASFHIHGNMQYITKQSYVINAL